MENISLERRIERVTHACGLHDAVAAARGSPRTTPPVVELHVDGEPGLELARLAESATSSSSATPCGRLAELILGGTTTECLRHARCPVVLIPADSSSAHDDPAGRSGCGGRPRALAA